MAIQTETHWTVEDVARFLRVKRAWVYERTAKGTIPCRKFDGLLRFDPAEIREWAREHAVGHHQPETPAREAARR